MDIKKKEYMGKWSEGRRNRRKNGYMYEWMIDGRMCG